MKSTPRNLPRLQIFVARARLDLEANTTIELRNRTRFELTRSAARASLATDQNGMAGSPPNS